MLAHNLGCIQAALEGRSPATTAAHSHNPRTAATPAGSHSTARVRAVRIESAHRGPPRPIRRRVRIAGAGPAAVAPLKVVISCHVTGVLIIVPDVGVIVEVVSGGVTGSADQAGQSRPVVQRERVVRNSVAGHVVAAVGIAHLNARALTLNRVALAAGAPNRRVPALVEPQVGLVGTGCILSTTTHKLQTSAHIMRGGISRVVKHRDMRRDALAGVALRILRDDVVLDRIIVADLDYQAVDQIVDDGVVRERGITGACVGP